MKRPRVKRSVIVGQHFLRYILINSTTDQILVLIDAGVEEGSVAAVGALLDEAG